MSKQTLHPTKEAIKNRCSIRKFRSDEVTDEIILELLEAARLAPSGCNSQPWRFKIVKDDAEKRRVQELPYGQHFVKEAPVVLVCCANIQGYLDGRVSGVQDLGKIGAFTNDTCESFHKTTHKKSLLSKKEISESIAFNVAIAIEHIPLRAIDYGLGTCWMSLR